jgi:chloramphenicol O-acetyltransferase
MFEHIQLSKKPKKSLWRKSSIRNWKINNDSSTYVFHDLCIEKLNTFCKSHGLNPFISFIKIVSESLKDNPEINTFLGLQNVYYRKTYNVFIHVLEDTKQEELSGMVIYDACNKSYESLNQEVSQSIKEIRSGKSFFAPTQNIAKFIPGFLIRPLFYISGVILYKFNFNLFPKLLPRDCFGSILVSNVGSVGLEKAFIPLVSHSGAHLALSYGKSFTKLKLVNNNVVEIPHVTLGFTFDHRVIDGSHLNKFINSIEEKINKL